MKFQIVKWLIVFYINLLTNIATSQEQMSTYVFKNEKSKHFTMPFKLINNLIIVPVAVNKSSTLQFILDSGVRTPIITELMSEDSVLINYAKRIKINGLGKGESLEAYSSTNNAFEIGKLFTPNQDIVVLIENTLHLSGKMGYKVNGLIGYDLLKDVILEINYETRRLRFHNPKFFSYEKIKTGVTLPLYIENKKPYIYGSVTLHNDTVLPVKLLIDTGGSMSLWLSESSDPRITIPSNHFPALLGIGLNGEITGSLARIKALRLGTYEMLNPITSFPDSASVSQVISVDKRHGSIGADVLKRFKVILDYPNNKITLIKNSNFPDEFHYNMSGIEVEMLKGIFTLYSIVYIQPGSPAALAGMQKNDQIFEINGKSVSDMELSDINYLFQTKDGKKISIVFFRDGERKTAQFKLKQVL